MTGTRVWIGSIVAGVSIMALVFLGAPTPATAATPAEIEQAIVKGLAFLDEKQEDNGSWGNHVGYTGLACLKFEDRARELGFSNPMDPRYEYDHVVSGCLDYITSQATTGVDISAEPDADGDSDGDGTVFGGSSVYTTAIGTMALAASQQPGLYGALVQDALDWLCFAQNNSNCGVHRGGWGYGANDCGWSDQSNGGYATLALGFAAAPAPFGFGLTIPQFVEDELTLWIDAVQDPQGPAGDAHDGGSWYSPQDTYWEPNILKTGNLMYEMYLVGYPLSEQRVDNAIAFIERHWTALSGMDPSKPGWRDHRQAMFTMMKGFQAYNITLIDTDGDSARDDDWFDEVSTHLVNTQGSAPASDPRAWPSDPWAGEVLSTAWALLTLEKSVPDGVIPTVTEWGLVIMTLMLLAGAKVYYNRRRTMRA